MRDTTPTCQKEFIKIPWGKIHFGGKNGILHGLGLGAGLGGLAFGRERDFELML